MNRALERLAELQPRLVRRSGPPSRDEVARSLAAAMGALIEAADDAAGAQEAAEHSDSHGRTRAMVRVREELESAAKALSRAGGSLLEFYFEGP